MNDLYDNFRSFMLKVVPGVDEKEIQKLFLMGKQSEFQKGQIFVEEGKICRNLVYIHRGLFRYYYLHDGNDITKDFAVDSQNPFCTAYTSFIMEKPSEIWIEALEPSTVLTWTSSDILPLFQELPWLLFAKRMADQLFFRKERRELEFLKCSAEERYQHFRTEFRGLSQRVPQYHIASYLAITPESLSRIRSKFQERLKS